MKKDLNIKLLLDICGISYTEDQLIKLEKLIEDFTQYKHNEISKDSTENYNSSEDSKEVKYENIKDTRDKLEEKELKDSDVKKCDTKFTTKILSNQHDCDTHKKSTKQCQSCQRKFVSEKALIKHRKNVQSCEKIVPNLCQHCGKVFETADQLR